MHTRYVQHAQHYITLKYECFEFMCDPVLPREIQAVSEDMTMAWPNTKHPANMVLTHTHTHTRSHKVLYNVLYLLNSKWFIVLYNNMIVAVEVICVSAERYHHLAQSMC